jgi:hypothetical protein
MFQIRRWAAVLLFAICVLALRSETMLHAQRSSDIAGSESPDISARAADLAIDRTDGLVVPACSQLANGLVSWWRAEGNALDQNNLNNGTLQNSIGFATGEAGRGFSLDGVDDYVSAPGSATLDVGAGAGFTIETWVSPSVAANGQPLVEWNNGGGGIGPHLWISVTSQGGVSGNIYGNIIDTSNNSHIIQSPAVMTSGIFQHVALTYDKNTGVAKLYRNGVEVQSTNLGVFTPQTTSGYGLYLGHRPGPGNYFQGLIDETSIYKRVLSPGEISSIYNAGIAGKCAACVGTPVDLISWWTADGNANDVRSRNNASLNGNSFATGKGNQAFVIGNGSGITAPDNASLNRQAFTIDAWVTATIYSCSGCEQFIVAKSGSNQSFGYELGVNRDSGNLRLTLNGVTNIFGNMNISDGTFHHVAATYDGATAKIYVDGTLDVQQNVSTLVNYEAGSPFVIGSRQNTSATLIYNGLIDELSFFGRVLSDTEIRAAYNAGGSCKCKPAATAAPSGLVGWWAGDGDPSDRSGNANNGSLVNGTTFALGKVGQTFSFNGGNEVDVPDAPSLNPTTQITLEAWVYPTSNSSGGNAMALIANKEVVGNTQYEISRRLASGICPSGGGIPTGNFAVYIGGISPFPDDCGGWMDGGGNLPLNAWSHVAASYDGTNVRAFVNGALTRTAPASGSIPTTGGLFRIGKRISNPENWIGQVDEVSLYNRGLTQAEVSIFNASFAGKLKEVTTNSQADIRNTKGYQKGGGPVVKPSAPQAVTALVGDATVSYPSVVGTGVTQSVPLNPASLTAMPAGYASPVLTYEISSTVAYSGSPSVCFNLPGVSNAQFANLRILHLEDENWIDRTAASSYSNLCTTALTSLSPFAIVPIAAPTAAHVGVAGRVMTADGGGISGATVFLTDMNGATRTARTNGFGYFAFADVPAGASYIAYVNSKRYGFAPQLVNTTDDVRDLDFTPTP